MNGFAIQSPPESAREARRLAARLGVPMDPIEVHRFPDGESRVTVGAAAATTAIYLPLDAPNEKMVILLLAAEALRRNGAKRLILIAPYLCYMRQDAAFHPGEAISQIAIGRLLATLVDRIVTVDAHLHRTADLGSVFPGIEADNLSAMPAIADALRETGYDRDTVLVGPDAESRPWVSDLAKRLDLKFAVGEKARHGDRAVGISFSDAKSITGRPVLLIDDIVSSGGTLIACAKALAEAGAKAIDAIATHALFPANLIETFAAAGIRSIRSTDSVAHPTNAIALNLVLAAALRRELTNIGNEERSP